MIVPGTDLELKDTSRTIFGGLGLGLKQVCPWPRRGVAMVLACSHGLKDVCSTNFSSRVCCGVIQVYSQVYVCRLV